MNMLLKWMCGENGLLYVDVARLATASRTKKRTKVLKIYHAAGTRSVRPIWLCYELDLVFEIEPVPFNQKFLSSPQWRAISPAGKLPILQDEDLAIFESGAMMEYILDRYGNGELRPTAGSTASAYYHQWSWFSESTLARPLGLNRMLRARDEESSDLAQDAVTKLETCLGVVEQALLDRQFILGNEFSAADIMLGYSLELVRRFKILTSQYPKTLSYLDRLKHRDACKRAMAA
jgi:glutathione S-transferase